MTFIHRSGRISVHDDAKTKARPALEGSERSDESEHRFQSRTEEVVSLWLTFLFVVLVTCLGNMMG